MESDNKLQTLQEEIKLLKGELKQSLVSVRDYLLNMELPSSEFSTILAALGGDEGQKMVMKGSLSTPEKAAPNDELTEMEEEEGLEDEKEQVPEDEEEQVSGDEEESPEENEASAAEDASSMEEVQEDEANPEDVLSPEDTEEENVGDNDEVNPDEPQDSQPHKAETEEMPMDYMKPSNTDITAGIPKVNMLANLLNWVARIRKDIGPEQIPIFLEVYGLSGYLSPELKEVIVQLSEMTEEHGESASYAEIWSNSMLSLHGILTGGDIPLHPVIPASKDMKQDVQPVEEEIIEVDKPVEKSATLKLVLPDSSGNGQEFCISLTPETRAKITKNSRHE
jgi:hypothetical protein